MEDFLTTSPAAEQRDKAPDVPNLELDPAATLGGFSFAMNAEEGLDVFDKNAFDFSEEGAPPAADPYLEAFDFLGLPSQQPTSPTLAHADLSLGTLEVPFESNNLDTLISPDFGTLALLQYFLPSQRSFGALNAIAEKSVVSPSSRPGSISVPQPLYLLPQQHFTLPPQQFTLPPQQPYDEKLPYSGLYLSLPPPPLLLDPSRSIPNSFGLSPPSYSLALLAGKKSDAKHLTQDEKLRRRREFHNAVERRRRDLIKEKIKELGALVPPLLLNPQVCAVQALSRQPQKNLRQIRDLLAAVKVKEAKPNKATILVSSVDYTRHLQKVAEQQRQRRLELEREVARLELQLREVKLDELHDFNPDEFFTETVDKAFEI